MVRNNQFIKRKIGTQYVIVATGDATKRFNGMITVNTTGSFIWDCLVAPTEFDGLGEKITAEYDVDAETAKKDAAAFLDTLKEVGAIGD